jgi:hypothetical protein
MGLLVAMADFTVFVSSMDGTARPEEEADMRMNGAGSSRRPRRVGGY